MQHPRVFASISLVCALAAFGMAQQTKDQPQKPAQTQSQPAQKPGDTAAKPAPPESAGSRLTSARNVMITRDRGSQIPYDVISSTIDGWGRFTMVDKADKADLVITVATTGGDGGWRGNSSSSYSPLTGKPESSAGGGAEFSDAEITMTVYDAKNKRVLWTGMEKAKSAMKQNARENNMVEAAEKLASKFHDRLEPPPKPPQD